MSFPDSDEGIGREDPFEAAAAWHARWRLAPPGGLSAAELEQWTDWHAKSDNRAAYDAVEFASRARKLIVAPQLPTDEELAADEAGEWSERQTARPPAQVRDKRWLRRRILPIALAATAAAIAFTVAPRLFHKPTVQPGAVYLFDTTAHEKRRYKLPDGTEITLGNQTHLSVHYGQCHRTVILEGGEAFFQVAHDPNCPFAVIAGNGQVTAIGTQFTVNRTLDRVSVSVAEGLVDVRPRAKSVSVQDVRLPDASGATWARTTLGAGQEVSFDGIRDRGPVESESPEVATSWIEGRREYRHEPLGYVVADINRYFGKQIVLEDSAAAQLEFTGRVYESQVMDWVKALETIFPVKVSQIDNEHIAIKSHVPR